MASYKLKYTAQEIDGILESVYEKTIYGDYQDVQSIIDGVVTRKVGVKVLNGTEEWVLRTSGTTTTTYHLTGRTLQNMNIDYAYNSNITTLCSHYNTSIVSDGSQTTNAPVRLYIYVNKEYPNSSSWYINSSIDNLAGFKQFLADQYAAGTPVIVVYPLATPTTEQVAGQTLTLTSGTNVIDITQASLNNLELEVKVKR